MCSLNWTEIQADEGEYIQKIWIVVKMLTKNQATDDSEELYACNSFSMILY
jgi:hypothetical protein